MQQNPILAVLKIIVLTVFTVFLIQSFIQTEWLEEKVVKTREKVDSLGANVAALGRRVDEAVAASNEAKDAAERAADRLDMALDQLERAPIVSRNPSDGGTNGGGGTPVTPRGRVQLCNGVEVYARNPGWRVVCDVKANDDPAAAIPEDQVDWDAVLKGVLTGEPPGLNEYSADGNVTVESVVYYATDVIAQRKQSDLTQWKGMLAERVEESPDRRKHMIYLRKNVAWHPPAVDYARQPWLKKQRFVTAADVKFTLDIVRNPDAGSPDKILFEKIESVELINEHQVLVTWQEARFYNLSATLDLRPLPAHIWGSDPDGKPYDSDNLAAAFNNHWFSKNLCGNGPYRFIEFKPGEYVRYERFEDYYGQRATAKEFIRFIVPDEKARLAKFFNKEVVINTMQTAAYQQYILEGDLNITFRKYEDRWKPAPGSWQWTYFKYLGPVSGGFAWNLRRPKLQDKRLRKALTMALDREAIADKLLLGLGRVIPWGESPLSKYYPEHIEPLPFDLEAARKLLEESGWIDRDGDGIREKEVAGKVVPLEIGLVMSAGSSLQRQIAQMYKNHLLEIGIRLDTQLVESALWSQKRNNREFDGIIVFWFAGWDSDPQQLWHSSKANEPNSSNLTGYSDAEADRITEELEFTFDYPKRIEMMRGFYSTLHDEQPYTWVTGIQYVIAVNADYRIPAPRLTPRPYIDARLIWKWKRRP